MAPNEDAGDWRSEARALAASAAALVRELAEEGLADFERLADLPGARALPDAASSRADSTRPARAEAVPEAPAAQAAPRPSPGVRLVRAGDRATLDALRSELGDCRRCGLCEGRQKIVFGDGNPEADILFVGEGPGEQEDRTGLPFVGRAGELLTQMIEKGMGIRRSDVYICNIVKCRPPGNRNPLPPEVSACRPFLDGQIEAVAPKVIVSLGKPAASLLLGREVSITRERGAWQEYRGIPLMPTLHPAFVLRQYTPENRRAVWQDLKAALERSRA
jgi:uracil-DNA glycosylase family 4